jgi:hypothetical protein
MDVSNIIRLLNQCQSHCITCDECKWATHGFCYSEEASKLINQISLIDFDNIRIEYKKLLEPYRIKGGN